MAKILNTACCIAGGGPAGMVAGFLLARAGADVVVLEKHADFLRDFRGDTIHPSTLEILSELGILDELLERPHQEVRQLTGRVAGEKIVVDQVAGTGAGLRELPVAGSQEGRVRIDAGVAECEAGFV